MNKNLEFSNYFLEEIQQSPCLDKALIVFLRTIIIKEIDKAKQSNIYNIHPIYDWANCSNKTKSMNSDTNESMLQLLSEALKVKFTLKCIDQNSKKDKGKISYEYDYAPLEKDVEIKYIIYYYSISGHYDSLYAREFISENQFMSIGKFIFYK